MKKLSVFLLSSAALALVVRPAVAEVIDYQNLVTANPNLLYYWSFDGTDNTTRQADKAPGADGSANLIQQTYGNNPTPVSFTTGWSAGFAPASTAAVTTRTGGDRAQDGASGAAFKTADASSAAYLNLPSTMTVEAIIQPHQTTLPGTFGVGYVAVSRPATNVRGAFLMQGSSAGSAAQYSDNLTALIGSSWSTGNELTLLDALTADDWYYTASTFEVSGGNTTITSYIANLSAGETTLTSLGSKTVNGSYLGSAPLGIGMANFRITQAGTPSEWYQSAFPGAIDEVAIYNAALSPATLQGHLNALWVPEPSGMVLMLFGLVGWVLATGRRRRGK